MIGQVVGRRILVVEDEYLLAIELEDELRDLGAVVVDTASSVDAVLALLQGETVEGAILYINRGGEVVFGLADALVERGIPYFFATGYGNDSVPDRFSGVRKCTSPAPSGSG